MTRLKAHVCSRRARFLALALVSFHCCLYLKARVEWMGRDNGNLAAKEYWVAGQGEFAWRALWMHVGGHPETWVVLPFVRVQEWIYRRGYRLLPENDGERDVWSDIWFVYPPPHAAAEGQQQGTNLGGNQGTTRTRLALFGATGHRRIR